MDLTSFFTSPKAWSLLTEDQKGHLTHRLPPHVERDESGCPSLDFLKYDMNFKSDVRQFKEDLANGRYEPEWLMEAKQAMEERAAGKFDAWKVERWEEYWGQKHEVDDHELSGALYDVQLEHLIANGAFQEGDVWFYTRSFGKGKKAFLIEHSAHLLEIDNYGKLKFTVGGTPTSSPGKRSHREAFNCVEDTPSPLETSAKALKLEDQDKEPVTSEVMMSGLDSSIQEPQPASQDSIASSTSLSHAADTTDSVSIETPIDQARMPFPSQLAQIQAPSSRSSLMQAPKDPDIRSFRAESEQPNDVSMKAAASPRPYNTRRKRAAPAILDPSHITKPKAPSRKPHFPLTIKIDSPEQLEKNIVLADGRRNWDPRTDSWKRFYCKRDGKDIGCLWNLREEYWQLHYGKRSSKA